MQFIDSVRFMASSLSSHVNNLAEEIHTVKWKYRRDNKKCETCGIKYKNCEFCPECTNFRDDLREYKCLCCKKNYDKMFDENL